MRTIHAFSLAAALTLAGPPALAQTNPAPTAGGATANSRQTQVPAGTAGPCGPGQQSDNLSGKLADCNGVITPPATGDGEIHQAAPDPQPNSTPVIRPQDGAVAK